MLVIKHDGDEWIILSQGATRDGKTYCHLASTTRFREQKNGPNPIQIGDWIDNDVILSCAIQTEEKARSAHECVPWRGRDGNIGLCIYCGRDTRDPITSYYQDRQIGGLGVLEAHR